MVSISGFLGWKIIVIRIAIRCKYIGFSKLLLNISSLYRNRIAEWTIAGIQSLYLILTLLIDRQNTILKIIRNFHHITRPKHIFIPTFQLQDGLSFVCLWIAYQTI